MSCTENKHADADKLQKVDKNTFQLKTPGDSIVELAIVAHGGDLYDDAHYQFKFRNKVYTFKNNQKNFEYTRLDLSDSMLIFDVMNGDTFERMVDNELVNLNAEAQDKFRESINSVIYFATLPHKLSDAAVFKKLIGTTTIMDTLYNVVEVSFSQEGGGKDHEDLFYYWFNSKTNTLDYLAYQYATNGGGVRFRSAYNRTVVEGIIFQDYVNYEVPVGTPLGTIPALYEKDSLKKLSLIQTELIKSLK